MTRKLPGPLKPRIDPLAGMREAFIAEAESSAAEVDAGGPLYAAKDVRAYVVARAAGKAAPRPKPIRGARRR